MECYVLSWTFLINSKTFLDIHNLNTDFISETLTCWSYFLTITLQSTRILLNHLPMSLGMQVRSLSFQHFYLPHRHFSGSPHPWAHLALGCLLLGEQDMLPAKKLSLKFLPARKGFTKTVDSSIFCLILFTTQYPLVVAVVVVFQLLLTFDIII